MERFLKGQVAAAEVTREAWFVLAEVAAEAASPHKIKHRIWPIPLEDLRCVYFADSAFDPKGERHQQGWLIGMTNPFLNKSMKAPFSMIMWKSRKLPRKAGSPTSTETYAAPYACADANWIRCVLFRFM